MHKNFTKVVFMFDVDSTLIDGTMQEFGLFDKLKISADDFWNSITEESILNNADSNFAIMYKILELAKAQDIKLSREFFGDCGKSLKLFSGLPDFFDRIKDYGEKKGINVEFYIISTGLKEIIDGASFSPYFKRIFASEYWYNDIGEPVWVSHNVNYTMKTQYIYRIRKGLIDKLYDFKEINDYVHDRSSLVSYENMIYIGDGFTDVPCMKMMTVNGGNSICVYKKVTKNNAEELLKNGRVKYIAPANYSKNGKIDKICKNIINEIYLKHKI